MTSNKLFFIFYLFFSCLSIFESYSQQTRVTEYNIDISSYLASENSLPFWLISNNYGEVYNGKNGMLKTSVFSDFIKTKSDFSFSYKASISGYISNESKAVINELYTSIKYKNVLVDLGTKNNEVTFEGLSISNGDIIKSTNSRAYPGINFKSNGFVCLPFAKNWLSTKFNYAEYILNDNRFADNSHLHNKSLFFKSKLSSKIAITAGLNHYAQWGGTSEEFGKQPSSFNDYIKIFRASSGGEDSYEGEQINALGNHLGSYLFQLDYLGEEMNWSFYWSHPFEDRSGRELINYPDATYGLFFDFKKPKNIITHLLTEITYTKDMSGSGTISGEDNYFNNTIYKSGWTYFGRTIGAPLFLTRDLENGKTPGIGENRFISYHIGFKGYLNDYIAYQTNLTYTNYPGWFHNQNPNSDQFSTSIECFIPEKKLPFIVSLGVATDFGNYSPFNLGGYLKLTKTGLF